MKKQILALLLATTALVTFSAPSEAQRWGWSEIKGPIGWARDAFAPLDDIKRYFGEAAPVEVNVVPVDVNPLAAKTPGLLANAVPALEEALAAIRTVVADDPVLLTNLKARGLDADNVVGLSQSPEGVTLFVSNA